MLIENNWIQKNMNERIVCFENIFLIIMIVNVVVCLNIIMNMIFLEWNYFGVEEEYIYIDEFVIMFDVKN